jgi:hypothetical protein
MPGLNALGAVQSLAMRERGTAQPRELSHRERVQRSDTRWLLAWIAVFAAATLGLLAAHQLYRFTGPHPAVTAFVRSLKHYARWLIPGQKGRRHSLLVPLPVPRGEPHYANASGASGQDAQRSNA